MTEPSDSVKITAKRPKNEQECLKQFNVFQIGTKTGLECFAQVNPNYNINDPAWSENCQRCVVAYELILRGYNVTAMPYDPADPIGDSGIATWKFHSSIWHLDPEVKVVEKKSQFEHDVKSCFKSWGKNARAIVRVEWAKTDNDETLRGHFLTAYQVEDKVVYLDPQSNRVWDIQTVLSLCTEDENAFWIMRVDNRELSDLVTYAVKNLEE